MQTGPDCSVFGRLGVRPEHERNLLPVRRRKGRKTSPFRHHCPEGETGCSGADGAGEGTHPKLPLPPSGRGNPMRQRDYSLSLWERVGVRVGMRVRVIRNSPSPGCGYGSLRSPSLRIPLPLTGARVQKERPISFSLTGEREPDAAMRLLPGPRRGREDVFLAGRERACSGFRQARGCYSFNLNYCSG